ncbi:MAG: hypothetical protein Pg6C_02540 [Treponemataceae bacterium]|nr:MAG: hypothetical protein Pg6C_02540 [Treponemataceae bacterium]
MTVPEGWKEISLLDCGEVLQGLTYRPENVKPYGLLVLRSSNIQGERLVFDDCVFVDCDIKEKQYVKKGDIIICVRNGSSELIGKCTLIGADYKATFGAFMAVFRGQNNGYIFQVFRSGVVQKQIRNTSNATINQITKRDFESIIIPIPINLSEQHAIAEVLSDMDGYIDSLEKLIAKKKAIKQGAMQELLTGKRRLPGFKGEWVEKSLGKLATINMGQSPDSRFYNSQKIGLPLIQGNGDIEKRKTIIRNYTSQITKIATKGEIILTVRAPVGSVAKVMFQCCLGRGVCSIHYENDFIYYYLTYIEPCWSNLSKGSTFDSINFLELDNLLIFLPCDVNEQTAIAAVLSDMDAEIEALTAKLNKAKSIKQGMMQELLTGRIRLINNNHKGEEGAQRNKELRHDNH